MAEKTEKTPAPARPATAPQPVQKKRKKKPIKKLILIGIFVGLLIFGVFYFVQYTKLSAKYKDVTTSAEEKNKATAAKVAKLIDLPKDETPVVFEIKDKDKLPDNKATKSFFEKANNGDIVLAYQKGNVAVIYRPSENRVIKTDNYQNFAAASNPISVAIIAPADQQDAIKNQLESKYANVQIVSKNTPKVSNGTSYVVDVSGTNGKTAQDLASALGLTVGSLPAGETKPDGAVLVVVVSPPATQ